MLRFIFGASGAGKSTTLHREITRRAAEDPGKNFYILVPDQFTMQTQTDVVRMTPLKGIMNIDVLSFSRLAHRVFDSAGYGVSEIDGTPRPTTVLDDTGKSLTLMRLALGMKKELPFIGSMMRSPSFVDEVKSSISEFMQYDIAPDDIAHMLQSAEEKSTLHGKLDDLQKLYAAFLAEIRTKYLTAEETYVLLAKRILEADAFRGAVVAFDGFTGFTPVQYRVIRSLLQNDCEVCVTLTLPGDIDPYARTDTAGVFDLSLKTTEDLLRISHEVLLANDPAGTPPFEVWKDYRNKKDNPDVVLNDAAVKRFADNPSMLFLEQELFRYHKNTFSGESNIHLAAALSLSAEVREVFRTIRRMLNEDESLFYRDFAIVAGAPESYEDTLLNEAKIFDMPLYIDRTANVRLNPLTEWIRAAIQTVTTGLASDSVFRYLRCGMTSFDTGETDLLEYYVRTLKIRGKKAWEEKFTRPYPLPSETKENADERADLFDRVNKLRGEVMASLAPLLPYAQKAAQVRELADAVLTMMDAQAVGEKLTGYAEAFREKGDVANASAYTQVEEKVRSLLEEAKTLLGEEKVTLSEFGKILDAAFSDMRLGAIPVGADSIIAGDIERTRIKDVKYLFFVGVSDHAIPKRTGSGGILTEPERRFLKEHVPDVVMAPSPDELMQQQRLYLYMNMTKPSKGLFLSYPVTLTDGSTGRPAYLFGMLRTLFPDVRVRDLAETKVTDVLVSEADALRTLPELMRTFAAGPAEDDVAKDLVTLCAILKENGTTKALTDAAFAEYRNVPLSGDLTRALYASRLISSVTRFELFASCAYAHFVQYGLRLNGEEEPEITAADLGTVFHGVLELFIRQLQEQGLSLVTVSDEEAEQILNETIDRFTASHRHTVFYRDARSRFAVERIRRILKRTVSTLRYQMQKGSFLTDRVEMTFEEAGDLEEINVALNESDVMRLRGRIDRVDVAREEDTTYVKVIDFKSSVHRFDIAAVYYGLQLQLVMYMDVACAAERKKDETKEVIPAALLYYSVRDPLIETDASLTEKDAEAINQKIREELKMTGLVNANPHVIELLDSSGNAASDVIPVRRNKDGSLSKTSQAATEEEMRLISAYVHKRMRGFGERILKGDIGIDPYQYGTRDSCTYCAYASVCGKDALIPGYDVRKLQKLDHESVVEHMREEVLEEK